MLYVSATISFTQRVVMSINSSGGLSSLLLTNVFHCFTSITDASKSKKYHTALIHMMYRCDNLHSVLLHLQEVVSDCYSQALFNVWVVLIFNMQSGRTHSSMYEYWS